MTSQPTPEELMRYLDGELPPSEQDRLEAAVERSTELQRELAVFRGIQEGFRDLSFSLEKPVGMWDQVSRRLIRPLGWVLLIVGGLVWLAYAGYVFTTSDTGRLEKLATGAFVIGGLMLLGTVVREQVRAWRTDPYRSIQR